MNRSLWRKAVALTLTAAMTAGLTAVAVAATAHPQTERRDISKQII